MNLCKYITSPSTFLIETDEQLDEEAGGGGDCQGHQQGPQHGDKSRR